MKYRKFVFFLLCLLFAGNTVSGSQICIKERSKLDGNLPVYDIYIEGNIERGDYDKFDKAINEIRQSNGVVYKVYLTSNGGDALEAMRIGRMIRKYFIFTIAPRFFETENFGRVTLCYRSTGGTDSREDENCACHSSCFLIWVAGIKKAGNSIGIHRPYFSEDYFAGLSAIEAQNKYTKMSNAVNDYLLEMGVPKNIIEKMFQITSKHIYYLDESSIESMRWVPFFQEWVMANCDELTKEESADYDDLSVKILMADIETIPINRSKYPGLSKAESFYYNFLDKKRSKYIKCFKKQMRDAQSNIK